MRVAVWRGLLLVGLALLVLCALAVWRGFVLNCSALGDGGVVGVAGVVWFVSIVGIVRGRL